MTRRLRLDGLDVTWHAAAACAGHPDPDAFHHPPTGDTGRRHIEQIIADYCLACPVRAECLAAVLALAGFDRWGTWGGVHWRGPQRPTDPYRVLPADVARSCGARR
jgi:WhiB family transcriptional regulator, redox-sensing transcriptional regulator